MRNKDTILDMTAGQRGQFTCDIIAPEGMEVELVGAVNLSGTPTQLALQADNVLVTPPMPPGFWLVEIRAGGVTILHGHLNVLQSPLADNAGEANFHVSADITQPLVHTTVTFTAGPRGKSAYDIWLDSGHEGDLQAFLASLKGEKGDPGTFSDSALEEILHQDYEQGVAAVGTDNVNTYGLALVTKRAGKVKSLAVSTRLSSGAAVNGTPLYCKLWVVENGDTSHPHFVALSDNAETQVVGEVSTWSFPADLVPELPAGSRLRFTFHTQANSAGTTYGQGLTQIGARCTANTLDDTGCLGPAAGINMASVVPVHSLTLRVDNYAPAHHVDDTTAHITDDERAKWNAAADNTAPADTRQNGVPLKLAGDGASREMLEEMFPDATLYIEQDLVAAVNPDMAPAAIVVSFAEGAEKRYALPASMASQVTLADNAAVEAHVLNPDIHLTGAVQETIMGLDGRFNNTERMLVPQVYNLGELTENKNIIASFSDASNTMRIGLPGHQFEYFFSNSAPAPGVEIWFELGDTAFNVTWPAAWIWVEGAPPALQASTAYRVSLRYEKQTHRFIARILYTYAIPATA